jgi:acyl-CoA reductase-like NAD-dependent aldehyde dehydrogenase
MATSINKLTFTSNIHIKKMKITNPATEEIIKDVQEDSLETLMKKFNSLQVAQSKWQRIPLSARMEVLQTFSGLLEKNIEHLAGVLTSEVGKPLQQSRNEINGARARIKWLTENAAKYLSDEIMTREPGLTEKISYEPLGVVCNISAWNYPYFVGVNVFVPALLAGNAVMYKPSEHSTLTGLEIEKLLDQAGIHENLFHVAVGAREVGERLLDLPFNGYYFTGSYKTGKSIYDKVAKKMVPCQLELGGKDPLYVADDVADVKAVAAGTADGAFYNNGQSCCAVERIYVHEHVYDQYVDAFIKEVKSWKLGSPTEAGVYIGPLARKEQLAFLEGQVNDAVSKGGKIETGGKRIKGKGYYFEPTVITNANHDMSLMRDESFGPIIGIMKVKDDQGAIQLMQDTDYGLTAAVYCKNQARAEAILREINAGTGYWNCCDRVSAALPWSGRQNSGFGATLSHAGLRAFTKSKAYHLKG